MLPKRGEPARRVSSHDRVFLGNVAVSVALVAKKRCRVRLAQCANVTQSSGVTTVRVRAAQRPARRRRRRWA
jgi:hypothetical protein